MVCHRLPSDLDLGLGAGVGIPLVPAGRPAGNVGVRFYTCLPVFFCVSFKLLFNYCLATSLSQYSSRPRAVGSFALLKPAKGFLYMNPSIGDIAYIILIHSTCPSTAGTMSGISKLSPPSCRSLPVLLLPLFQFFLLIMDNPEPLRVPVDSRWLPCLLIDVSNTSKTQLWVVFASIGSLEN